MFARRNASSKSSNRRTQKNRGRGKDAILKSAADSAVSAASVERLEDRTLLSTTLTVNTTADPSAPVQNQLSLREALAQVAATPGDYVIDVPTGDYQLDPTQGTLVVDDTQGMQGVTIQSTSGTATIDAQSSGSVFQITTNTKATLIGLTLTGGNNPNAAQGGGAIFNSGTLTLNDSTLTGNTAYNGGAIFNAHGGDANVYDSTINANYGVYGGAADNAGVLRFHSTTITNNTAANFGAITTTGGLLLTNTTITGNTANAGAGAVYADGGNVYMHADIIANDTQVSSSELVAANGSTFHGSYSLVGDGSGNLIGTHDITGDPLLAPLGNYGGNVQTMALLPGSPALETGGNIVDSTDARGVSRGQTVPDMGAYESRGFTVTATNNSGTQTASINAPFADLSVHVVAVDTDLTDLTGGVITFTAPGSGASVTLGTAATLDSSGNTSVTATANGTQGSYAVTASAAPTKGTLASFDLTNTAPVDPTINVTGATVTYDGDAHGGTITATGTQGEDLSSLLHVSYKQGSNPETSDVPVDAGTYNIWVSFDGNGSYNAVTDHDTGIQIVIGQASPVLNINGATAVYNKLGHTATGTATGVESTPVDLTSLLHLSYQVGNGSIVSTAPTNAATYKVLYTFSGNTDYAASASNVDSGQTVVISQTSATFSFTGTTVTFNNASHGLTAGTATGLSNLNLNSLLSYTYVNQGDQSSSSSTPVHAGTYEVFAAFAGNTNYAAVSSFDTNRQIVINKANATFSIHGVTTSYNNASHAGSGTATGLASLDLSSLLHLTYKQGSNAASSTAPTNAGTYEIYYSFDGNNDYNAVSSTDSTKTVQINQATLIVQVTGASSNFDGNSHSASAIVTNASGLNNLVSLTYKDLSNNQFSSNAPTHGGTYEVFAALSGNSNYATLTSYDSGAQVVISKINITLASGAWPTPV